MQFQFSNCPANGNGGTVNSYVPYTFTLTNVIQPGPLPVTITVKNTFGGAGIGASTFTTLVSSSAANGPTNQLV